MRRSNLEKTYFIKQTNESLKTYNKEKHFCSKLYKKERKKFFGNLNTSVVSICFIILESNKTLFHK